MLKGKELLLEIINNALLAYQSGSNEQQIAFNNTELKAFFYQLIKTLPKI